MPVFNRRIGTALTIALGVAISGGAALAWHLMQPPQLAAEFASGNGRLEATELDVATKLAGRLVAVAAREGDNVSAGQPLARIDADDLNAALREAAAQLQRAIATEKQMRSQVKQREGEYRLAKLTLERSRAVLAKGLIAKQTVDQHESQLQTAAAALDAAREGVQAAAAASAAARAGAERISINIADSTLIAPIDGRVLYRLAEPGEVLAAGGKVLTLIDLSDVYMPIFLPTEQVGRVRIGADARIVFDAMPKISVPAKVSFVAPRAQFTPKEVETRSEREKLMFRVKVQIDPALLKSYNDLVKTGVPGVTYVRLDANAAWPNWLPPPVSARPPASNIEHGAIDTGVIKQGTF
jgi:HlyD family secretion protein